MLLSLCIPTVIRQQSPQAAKHGVCNSPELSSLRYRAWIKKWYNDEAIGKNILLIYKEHPLMPEFKVEAPFQPTGDQPGAIEQLVEGIRNGYKNQTLLGVTGSEIGRASCRERV